MVDSAVLGIVGFLLGLCFFRQFMAWGSWGRLLGFAIALLYFGPLNSRLGDGQTIGKRTLKVRVTTAAGRRKGESRKAKVEKLVASNSFASKLAAVFLGGDFRARVIDHLSLRLQSGGRGSRSMTWWWSRMWCGWARRRRRNRGSGRGISRWCG